MFKILATKPKQNNNKKSIGTSGLEAGGAVLMETISHYFPLLRVAIVEQLIEYQSQIQRIRR